MFANGDRLEVKFPTGTDTTLEILNIESNRFVLFSFGEEYGWVQVSVGEVDGRTRLDLLHFGLPTEGNAAWEVHANARGWWIYNLLNAKSTLLHGKDLRVRDPETSGGPAALYPVHERERDHDWRNFDIYLRIDAAPEEVITAWRSPAGLESFFIARALITDAEGGLKAPDDVIEAEDRYDWQFIHDYSLDGEFLLSEPTRVRFTFGEMTVTVTAEPANGDTLLHLQQQGMKDTPDARVMSSLNCRCCWMLFLVNLKSVVEYGNDLRDMNPDTADAIAVSWPAW